MAAAVEAARAREAEPRGATRRLSAIVFTDIAGYTAMMQEDESRARLSRDRHRAAPERHTQSYGGRTLQHFGDGTLSVFNSAIDAVASSMS
jgi:class 3 adenylate cyclase